MTPLVTPAGRVSQPQTASQRARNPETPEERHARRLAWGAEWGEAMRELKRAREERRS